VDSEQQRLEVEPVRSDDDDLAVDDTALGQRRGERGDELREVAVHRLLVAALEQNLVAVTEHERTKAVPLGLELPPVAPGKASAALDSIGASGGAKGRRMGSLQLQRIRFVSTS